MKAPRPDAVPGFSLIEVLTVVAIFGILLSIAVPAFSRWIADTRLRNQAGYVLSGLQLAKGEALKRNSVIRFQLVSTMTNTCAIAATSNLWLVSDGDPTASCGKAEVTTISNCNAPYGPYATGCGAAAALTPPNILVKGNVEQQTTAQSTITVIANSVAVTAPDQIACFAGTGRLARVDNATQQCTTTMNPGTTSAPSITLDFNDPSTQDGNSATSGKGLCFSDAAAPAAGFHASGTVRCQRIMVSPAGEIRMCDPGLLAAKHPGDPRVCS